MDEATILSALFAAAQAIGVDPERDATARARLESAARKAAVELQHTARTEVNLPVLGATASGPVHLAMTLPDGARGHAGPRLDPREKLS